MTQSNSVESLLQQGNDLIDRGKYQAALEIFQQAEKQEPLNSYVLYHLARTFYEITRYQESVEYVTKALEINADDISAWTLRGRAYEQLKQNTQASADFNQAISIEAKFSQDWDSQGVALDSLNRDEKAIYSYNKAIEIIPENYNALNNRSIKLSNLGRYEEAIADCTKIIKLQPQYHSAWYNRGHALSNLGRYEEAISDYNKVIELETDYHLIWHHRGKAMHNLGRYQEAISDYDKAIELQPQFQILWYNRSDTYYRLGNRQKANYNKQRALELTQPQNWQDWNNVGCLIHNLDSYKAAIEKWQEGLQTLLPEIPQYQQGCGELCYNQGRAYYLQSKQEPSPRPFWRDAIRLYRQALRHFEPLVISKTNLNTAARYLSIVQDLIKVSHALEDSETAQRELDKGSEFLEQLLLNISCEETKIRLARQFAAFSQFEVDKLAQSPDPKKHIEALEKAEKRKNLTLQWLKENRWTSDDPESPNYAKIQSLLKPNSAAIYWHISPNAITTFILKPNQPLIILPYKSERQRNPTTFYPDPDHQLKMFQDGLSKWQKDYETYRKDSGTNDDKSQNPWRKQMVNTLKEIGDSLNIQAINRYLDDVNQLILIPHRQLHLLPLHGLFSPQLIITYLPSAEQGLYLQNRSNETPPQETSVINLESLGNPPLLYGCLESTSIGLIYENSQFFRGTNTTLSAVMETLQEGADIFHFTGHAEHNINQPQKSGLILTADRSITIRDIFSLNLEKCKLVCLSACETGISSQENLIDEYISLSSAFLKMGATHVLSTLWTVEEKATALLLIEFYLLLKQGIPPAQALRDAKNWLRNSSNLDLAQWYRNLPTNFKQQNKKIQHFLQREADIASMNSDDDRPYRHPYYRDAFILTGAI